MFHIVLIEPEIPPNTGNIIRLCANTGCILHLVQPLGFRLEDKQLRRAGLDYHEYADLKIYPDFSALKAFLGDVRYFALSTKATDSFYDSTYQKGDVFIFGPETRGLSYDFLAREIKQTHLKKIPMQAHSRSLNLSNAVAVCVFEAWRQQQFS